MAGAGYWIEKLALSAHPEGGFYRESYAANLVIPAAVLPSHKGDRCASTAIYYLLSGEDFSAFHRITSDEMWHFYAGSCLQVHVINARGEYQLLRLGPDPDKGHVFQAVVPAGCWFAASLEVPGSYSLVGCTVSPGFNFADFELATRAQLLTSYPQFSAVILRHTRVGY